MAKKPLPEDARGSSDGRPAAEESADASSASEPSDAESPDADSEPDTAESAAERVYTDPEVRSMLSAAEEQAKDQRLRVLAEYDNYRRRVAREREQWSQEAIERFARDLLAVVDSFDRALAAAKDADDPVLEGVRVTQRQLLSVLQKHGVEVVDPTGRPFDPRFHEALLRAPRGDAAPGTVLAVLEKGYLLEGRLLRPARVQVAAEE